MIRTLGSSAETVSLTLTGEGASARGVISTCHEPCHEPSNSPRSPRPLKCIDRFPIKSADGLDDMLK